ncbi:MAG: CpsB/CapC family capsule biosynthesis tyrosine phosphatase [Actinomycetota bacterium]
MIDLHSHILPGLDDGVRTLDEACDLAYTAAAEGVEVMAATPHVRADYPTTAGMMEAGVAELRAALLAEAIDLHVVHGGEVALELIWALPREELRRFTLAQTGRYLLVEFPYRGWPPGVSSSVSALVEQGVTPLLAHPERNPEVQDRPERLEELVGAGALVQVTAASLDGRLDRAAQSTAKRLLELGLVHVLASDAHAPHVRKGGLEASAAAVGDEVLARYLTVDVPGAIVSGAPVPDRPQVGLEA